MLDMSGWSHKQCSPMDFNIWIVMLADQQKLTSALCGHWMPYKRSANRDGCLEIVKRIHAWLDDDDDDDDVNFLQNYIWSFFIFWLKNLGSDCISLAFHV